MKTVLIFGFEPFGGRKVNTSEAIVRAIGDITIARIFLLLIGRYRALGSIPGVGLRVVCRSLRD